MNAILEITGKLFRLLIDIAGRILNFAFTILNRVYDKFLDVSVPEKIIFLNSITAFFAIILSVARYYLFETYFYINNPLAVYMLGIVIVMFITLYFSGFLKLVIRFVMNAYYLFWIIYLPLAGELTKADPYQITTGYYLNIIAPAIYITASLFSYFYSYE